jgi:hypothetical protein
MEVKMVNEAGIVLDEYEQGVEDALDTFAPVSPETRRRLDAILAREKEQKNGNRARVPLAAAPV